MILVYNFHLQMEALGKNVIIIGDDVSSTVHIDNKGIDTLILGKGPTQGLVDTTWTVEAKYPINFTQSNRRFEVYTIMEATVSYLLMLQKYINLRQNIQK